MISHFRIFALLLLGGLSLSAIAQPVSSLSVFDPLVNKSWRAEGTWSNGQDFKQEISFEYDLEKTLVKTVTNGFLDNSARPRFGKRNLGIRKWDKTRNLIHFWEFDILGQLTEGVVRVEGDNLYYQYEYPMGDGITLVTDGWEKINDYQYRFIVGEYAEGKWTNKYLETIFEQAPRLSGNRADIDQILANVKQFSKDVMASNYAGIASAYADNGKIFPANAGIIEGKPAIHKQWMLPEGTSIPLHKIRPMEITVIEDTAYDYGYYNGQTLKADGTKSNWRGKYVVVWKKINGKWKMYLDIWNRIQD